MTNRLDQPTNELNPTEVNVALMSFSSCSLSIPVTAIFLYFFLKNGNIESSFPSRLVFLLSANDMINWTVLWISDLVLIASGKHLSKDFCNVYSIFNHFFMILTLMISFTICFFSYLCAVWRKNITKKEGRYVILIILLISFVLTLIPYFLGAFGYSNSKKFIACWLATSEDQFWHFYFILYICFLLEIYLIFHSLICIYKLPFVDGKFKKKLIAYLSFYPLNLFLTWLPGITLNILLIQDKENNYSYTLDMLDSFSQPLEGIFNCLIYLNINENLRNKMGNILCHPFFDRVEDEKEIDILSEDENIETLKDSLR